MNRLLIPSRKNTRHVAILNFTGDRSNWGSQATSWELLRFLQRAFRWDRATRLTLLPLLPRHAIDREIQDSTGEALMAAAPEGARIVALDERGRAEGSAQFAKRIEGWRDNGVRGIAFLIGGADGLSDDVRKRADLILSFGTMTWPHMLVRAMLAEQLYRAHSILTGHPYHRA